MLFKKISAQEKDEEVTPSASSASNIIPGFSEREAYFICIVRCSKSSRSR
jgi:hypothetical protein